MDANRADVLSKPGFDPIVRHKALGITRLSRALQAEAWSMYDAWDSVSVVATSLFLPQAITELSQAAGSPTPRALWSFLGTITTVVSLVAFLAVGPICESGHLPACLSPPFLALS